MANRTRGEVLLNAYMNRYVNDQASSVNKGKKNIQSAESAGAKAISSVPTDLPELTDYSSDVYSGLLENDKTRRKALEEAVKAAQEEAEKAAKEAEKAAKSYSSSRSRSSGSSRKSSKSSSQEVKIENYGDSNSNKTTTSKSSATNKSTNSSKSKLEQLREKKNQVLNVKQVQENLDNVQKKEEQARAAMKKSEGNASNYAAGRSGVTTSTDIGIASTYGAGAQAREAKTTQKQYQQYAKEKAQSQVHQKALQAKKDAEKKTVYNNLKSDEKYLEELAKPGVRLSDSQIEAANQYLKEQPSFSEKYKEYKSGKISLNDLENWQSSISNLKQKVSFGGLGQDMQAFTSGLVKGTSSLLRPLLSPVEDKLNEATGGLYNELHGGQGVIDTLEDYGEQSTVGNVAGQFAGNAATYGLANSFLAGTKAATVAGQAGEQIASALSKIPVVGNLVRPGTGQAIGNILVGEGTDIALDTIPSFVNDVYDYSTGNPDNLTRADIAGRTAANIGVNAAMNVGSEALPALISAGKNAIQNSVSSANEKIAKDVQNSIPEFNTVLETAPQTDSVVDLEDAKNAAISGYKNAPALTENDTFYPRWVQAQTTARQAELGLEVADTPESISRNIQNLDNATKNINQIYDQENAIRRLRDSFVDANSSPEYNRVNDLEVNANENVGGSVPASVQDVSVGGQGIEPQPGIVGAGIYDDAGIQRTGTAKTGNTGNVAANGIGSNASLRAQEITGKSRKSVYTRDIESVFEKLRNGASPESLQDEATRIAQGIVKDSDFTYQGTDEATDMLKNYLKSTPIRIDEKAASDILYNSGLKNIQQYNIQNGTKFSLTAGVPYDTAMQELAEMNVGVTGDTVDDLMDAVQRSKAKAPVDSDLAASYTDYVRDKILSGSDSASETFDEWLERQGFDYNAAPQYTKNVYDRWTNDGLPEVAIGAEKTQFNRDIVPNRDYAGQRAARLGLDDEHSAMVGTSEHQVWTDAEANAQAADDLSLYMQESGGDFDKAMDAAIADLRSNENWDKGATKTAQQVRDRLKTQFMQSEPGTADFYKNAARYESFRDTISERASKAGQNLQALKEAPLTSETGVQKMRQVSNDITEKWANSHKGQDGKIKEMADELEALKNEIRERDISDMEREAMQGMAGAQSTAGPQDAEFDSFVKEQGVKTDPTAEFEELVQRVKDIAAKNKVTVSDEGAKSIAGKIQAGESAESYYNKLANEAAGITDLSLDEMEIIDDLYAKAAELPDSKERYELEQQALQIMASHLPAKSWFERFDNFRYLAMLGNTRTHVRNLLGNVGMSAVTKAKDEVAAALQLAIPQNKRTKALYTPQDMKTAARQYLNEQAYSRALKDGGKYNLAQGLEAARKTYGDSAGGRILQKLTDLNSNALTREDEIFLESGFVRSLASNLSAKGYGPEIFSSDDIVSLGVLDGAVEQAIKDAKEMTFHADNALTRIFGSLSNLGDKKGSLGQKMAYILGNGLLPFSKTPANILKTSLEYTPFGGVIEAAYRGAKGQGAASVTDALSKSIVGSGLLGAGWLLADAGFLQGSSSDETSGYNSTLGAQDYSVKIPAVGAYTIDWSAPAVVPFLMGANLSAQGADLTDLFSDESAMADFAKSLGDVMMKALDPVTETSMLQSLNNTLENIRYTDNSANLVGDLGTSLVSSYAQQFIPTAFGQIARTVDPVRRSTYGGGDTQLERNASYTLQKTENKIPGLSMTNEPYIDQWGREEASLDGTGNDPLGFGFRLVYNTLSPGYFSAENVTPVDAYVQELFEDTGDASVIPQVASSKVNVNGKNVYMTPEQKTQYAKTSGQLAYNMIDELQDFSAFSGLSSTQQADIVSDVYSLSKKVGAKAAFPEYENDDKLYQAYLSGGEQGAISYLLAKSATDAVKEQGDGASTADIWDAANSLGLDESSTVQAFLAQTSADSVSRRVYDVAGDSGVSAYMNAYSSADQNGNGDVSQSEMRYALLSSDLDDVMLSDVYQAAFPKDEKTQQAYSAFGDSGVADWLLYYDAYSRQEKSGQAVAESLLDQLGYPNDVKAEFWRMTNKGWKDSSNPYA